ncbi:unnamed protein product [Amoebophrya sp. A25]|nr:unnamed protein product [Amoebophrya sp. A25]|eukprot:GSA25T00014359001.1
MVVATANASSFSPGRLTSGGATSSTAQRHSVASPYREQHAVSTAGNTGTPALSSGLMPPDQQCSVTRDLVSNLWTLSRESANAQQEMNAQTFQHLYAQNRALQQMLEDKATDWQQLLDTAELKVKGPDANSYSATKQKFGRLVSFLCSISSFCGRDSSFSSSGFFYDRVGISGILRLRKRRWRWTRESLSNSAGRDLIEATKQWEERINRLSDSANEQFAGLKLLIAKKEETNQEELAQLRAYFAKELASHQTLHDRADRTLHEQALRLAALEQEVEEAARTKALEQTVAGLAKDVRELGQRVAAGEQTTNQNMNKVMANIGSVHEALSSEIFVGRDELQKKQLLLEEQLTSHGKKNEYAFALAQKDLRSVQELAMKDLEKVRDEFTAKLHTQHMTLDKQLLATAKEMDVRLARCSDELKACEIRTKEGFQHASADVSALRTSMLNKLNQEETTRDHLLTQIRDAVDYTNKTLEQKTEELAARIEAEQRVRSGECSTLGMSVGDLQTRLDEVGHEISSFRHQVAVDFVTEKKHQDTTAEVTGKILLEANRRVQEIEQLSTQLYETKTALSETERESATRAAATEGLIAAQKTELIARLEDVWSEMNGGRLSYQKLETLVSQQNSDRMKDLEKRKQEILDCREAADRGVQSVSGELERRIQQCCDFVNVEQQRMEDTMTEKHRKLTEDVRRLQSGLSSEANVRMLDVENVFARMQMLKEEVVAQVESEKRQRLMGEEKLTTDQGQVRRLLETGGTTNNSPRSGARFFFNNDGPTSPVLRSAASGNTTRASGGEPASYMFAEANSSWLSAGSSK